MYWYPFSRHLLLRQATQSAVEAAMMDPRFRPVRPKDLTRLIVEVTVLFPPEEMAVEGSLELRDKVEIGRHGLLVEGNGLRGLLLPQGGCRLRV